MNNRISLKSKVYDAILADISNGLYKPNDIITEGMLTARFEVSKAPVREAMIELCKDQILQSLPRFGYQVIPYSISEINDLLDVRTDIEVANLRRAFDKITLEDLERLSDEKLFIADGDNTEETSPNYNRNFNFHLKLCELSGNKVSYSMLENILKRSSRFFHVYFSHASKNQTESKSMYHHEIIESLKSKDLEKACDALRKDIDSVRYQLQEVIFF